MPVITADTGTKYKTIENILHTMMSVLVRYVPRAVGPDAAARDGTGIRDGTGVRKRTKTEERTYCQGITLGPRESQS